MKIARVTLAQFVVIILIVIVLVFMFLPTFQTVHWVGSTDLEIDFLVIDTHDGSPIQGATIQIHSEGGLYDEDQPQDFALVTDADGIAKRVCRNSMCFGTKWLEY